MRCARQGRRREGRRLPCGRRLWRLVRLGALGALGAAAYTAWQRSRPADDTARLVPTWPPIDTADRTPGTPFRPAGSSQQRWLAPVDGACPEGYPIKANTHSGIFHVPGGRFYERTVAERCYANAEDAVADGYRAAKA